MNVYQMSLLSNRHHPTRFDPKAEGIITCCSGESSKKNAADLLWSPDALSARERARESEREGERERERETEREGKRETGSERQSAREREKQMLVDTNTAIIDRSPPPTEAMFQASYLFG